MFDQGKAPNTVDPHTKREKTLTRGSILMAKPLDRWPVSRGIDVSMVHVELIASRRGRYAAHRRPFLHVQRATQAHLRRSLRRRVNPSTGLRHRTQVQEIRQPDLHPEPEAVEYAYPFVKPRARTAGRVPRGRPSCLCTGSCGRIANWSRNKCASARRVLPAAAAAHERAWRAVRSQRSKRAPRLGRCSCSANRTAPAQQGIPRAQVTAAFAK